MTRVILLTAFTAAMAVAQIEGAMQEPPPSQTQPVTGTASITGTVVNDVTGEPLKKAQVSLFGAAGRQPAATTDASGGFAFQKLPPGPYTLMAVREGFDQTRAMLLGDGQKTITLVDDQKKTGVELRLPPTGAISGRLTDEIGDPAPNCSVGASSESGGNPQRGYATTDDRGEYRISNLPAGRYIVYQHCFHTLAAPHGFMERGDPKTPEWAWVPGFYGNAASGAGASVLSVHPGEEIHGIDFRLKTTNAFTVSIIVEPDSPIDMHTVMLRLTSRDPAASQLISYGVAPGSNGEPYRTTGVVPGSYLATADAQQGEKRWHGETVVEVGETPPDLVRLPIGEGMTITGDLKIESAGAAASENQGPQDVIALRGIEATRMTEYFQAQADADGNFAISGVQPGRYQLVVMGPVNSIQSVTLGGHEVSAQGFEIAAGAGGPLHVVINIKQVALQVSVDGLKADRITWVFALPKGFSDMSMGMNPPMAQAQQNAATMQVAPGEYTVYAVESSQPWPLLASPSAVHALASLGKSIEVKEGADASVTVNVVGRDDLKRAIDGDQQ